MASGDNGKTGTLPAVASGRLNGVFDAALEIAMKRRELLGRLRTSVKTKDMAEVLLVAKELCGLDDEKSNRVN